MPLVLRLSAVVILLIQPLAEQFLWVGTSASLHRCNCRSVVEYLVAVPLLPSDDEHNEF